MSVKIVKRFLGIFLPVAVLFAAAFSGFYENKKIATGMGLLLLKSRAFGYKQKVWQII